jgi:hypothetical protein
MAEKVFTRSEVGNYMNDKFISVAIQMDRTATDLPEIRKWYNDAQALRKDYSVFTFPTYLFFSPDGKAVHRFESASETDFIVRASETFMPDRQYYGQNSKVIALIEKHRNDSSFLFNAIDSALNKRDYTNIPLMLGYYMEIIKLPLLKKNLRIIERASHFSNRKNVARFLIDNNSAVKVIDGTDIVDQMIIYRLTQDELLPLLLVDSNFIDWSGIALKLEARYPGFGDRVVAAEKPDYYFERGQFEAYGKALVEYMDKYQKKLDGYFINGYAWSVFQSCADQNTLLKASKWIKDLIDKQINSGHPDANNIDTYANLLYKIGDKENAQIWERKALQFAIEAKDEKEIQSITGVLNKIQNGDKTWD